MRLAPCLLLFACLSLPCLAQAPPDTVSPSLRFEVATIKPGNRSENAGIRIVTAFTRVETANTSVTDLIKYAYSVHPDQILGGPNDLMHRSYAIQATINAERPNVEVLRQMFRNLLTDRFNLAFHHEKRELPVYVLTADTPNVHLKATEEKFVFPTGGYGKGFLSVRHGSPRDLAAFLQRYVTSRPVIDRTGIEGAYDMDLHFTPNDIPADSASATDYPNLYTAIHEQLGLKLTATKASVDVIVIDKVTEPSEN